MTLDNDTIVELMQVKSDLSKAQIKEYLQELAEKISALSEGQEYVLDDIGLFYVKDDTLQFDPDEKLATEINYKYAGMQPLEIMEANKAGTSSTELEELVDRTQEHAKKSKTGEDEKEVSRELETDAGKSDTTDQKIDEKLDTEEEDHAEKAAAGDESENDTGRDIERIDEDKEDDQSEPIGKERDQAEDEIRKKESQKVAETDEHDSKNRKSKTRKGFNAQDRAQKDSIFSLVNTLAAIVIIIGVGYLVYRFDDIIERRNQGNAEQVVQQQTKQQADKSDVLEEGDENENTNANSESKNQDNPQQVKSDIDPTTTDEQSNLEDKNQVGEKTPGYGLRGDLPETALEGYTIVVHSLKSKAAAENRKAILMNKNYRAIVMGVELADQDTTWRVGIGHFKTVEDALEATENLESPYKENHFIKRIIQ